jgi:ribosomal protein S18 acetylase RimI-like enzyme
LSANLPPDAPATDRRLQAYLRKTAARGRDVSRVGPFVVTLDRHSDHPYLNYAIPDVDAHPAPDDVHALIAAFRAAGRVPRLEYLPSVAPSAEAALLAGGFEVQDRLPSMTAGVGDVVDAGDPDAIELLAPSTDDELRATTAVQVVAFGEPAPAADAPVADRRALLDAGGLVIAARDRATGAVVGGGVATAPDLGLTEIAGIGVAEPYRRRGIGGAITARLARDAFERGVTTAYISPGHDGAQRTYARVGFRDTSVMLHLWIPGG